MYYPLKFKALYKDYIWGGRKLESLGKTLPDTNIAESWEISGHPDGTSIVSNGKYRGHSLSKLTAKYSKEILGTALYSNAKFPLLIKFIDANKDLSVQVHPDDDYAYIHENGELGKNEMWYVVDAEPGTKLVAGVKDGITKQIFKSAIAKGTITKCLNFISVSSGDCINIPAGLIHAIGAGCLICEIQQNSNTTYRVYDYDRTDANGNKRPLHTKKALDVINFNAKKGGVTLGLSVIGNCWTKTFLVANMYFAVEKIDLSGTLTEDTKDERFHCYTVIKGSITINNEEIGMGCSCLIPGSTGSYSVKGTAVVIKSYVPDLEENIYIPLLNAGYSKTDIDSIIGRFPLDAKKTH
jgi:mannose-6-phosphate isomerase